MIYPIVAYGDPVLRKKAKEIDANHPNLKTFIDNMWETMYESSGVGLAAPQVGESIRLFLVDSIQILENLSEKRKDDWADDKGVKDVFINPKIISRKGEEWVYNEGCLSIPKIKEDVTRHDEVHIQYYDADFKFHDKKFVGLSGRIIQHEFDHIEGTLFIDHLKPLKKRLLKRRLEEISQGKVVVDYKMRFPKTGK
jgi:peptide deformylase